MCYAYIGMTHSLLIIIGRFFSRYPFELFINVRISQERCYYLGLVVVSAWLIAVIIGCTKHSNKRLITISRIFLLVCSKSASFFCKLIPHFHQTGMSLFGHRFMNWLSWRYCAPSTYLILRFGSTCLNWRTVKVPAMIMPKPKRGNIFTGVGKTRTEVRLEGGRRENGESQKEGNNRWITGGNGQRRVANGGKQKCGEKCTRPSFFFCFVPWPYILLRHVMSSS